VPGSRGGSAAALELGRAIQRLRPDVQLVDALRGAARQSTRSRKKRGARPLAAQQMIMLRRREVRLPEGPVFLLDNVVDTGATIRAARRALGFDAPVAAIAHTGRHT
jgi:predicted amidophosphoribosyltransferase